MSGIGVHSLLVDSSGLVAVHPTSTRPLYLAVTLFDLGAASFHAGM